MASLAEGARSRSAAAAVLSVVAAAAVPKCPACVAAWLVALGLGGSAASALSPVLRDAALAVSVAAAVFFGWSFRRTLVSARERRSAGRQTCCH